jgi:hypothetical protein
MLVQSRMHTSMNSVTALMTSHTHVSHIALSDPILSGTLKPRTKQLLALADATVRMAGVQGLMAEFMVQRIRAPCKPLADGLANVVAMRQLAMVRNVSSVVVAY